MTGTRRLHTPVLCRPATCCVALTLLLWPAHTIWAQEPTRSLRVAEMATPASHAETLSASAREAHLDRVVAATNRVQLRVDDFRARLSIPDAVVVSIVETNTLVVSVERFKGHDGTFALSVEGGFVALLNDDELGAVVAHELGHVWIFTHHPYLQTEELANQIALRVVSRDSLDHVYEKVWARTGTKGSLAYFPGE